VYIYFAYAFKFKLYWIKQLLILFENLNTSNSFEIGFSLFDECSNALLCALLVEESLEN
jgi:hypothetical protein